MYANRNDVSLFFPLNFVKAGRLNALKKKRSSKVINGENFKRFTKDSREIQHKHFNQVVLYCILELT